jgi:uncharacterized RmlC-like cupin family protein
MSPAISASAGLVVVRPDASTATREGLPAFVGVSGATAGATGLCMNLVEIPPGAAAEPHAHVGFETAIYIVQGDVETRWGAALEARATSAAGDFLFIAPGVPHQPRNLSDTVPVLAIVARNTPAEQESVLLVD